MDEHEILEACVKLPEDMVRRNFANFESARRLVVGCAEETIRQAGFKVSDYDCAPGAIVRNFLYVDTDEFGKAIGEPYEVAYQFLTWTRR